VHDKLLEGSFNSHQVPLPNAKTDSDELSALGTWLSSYSPQKVFTKLGEPISDVLSILPSEDKKMGQRPETYANYRQLSVPDWRKYGVPKGKDASPLIRAGDFLDQAFLDNPKSLRIFSPDELVSNKLDAVFRHTGRNFQWDQYSNAEGGRVIEILSEHTCQGFLQGYTMTGRVGIFHSYEAFLGIIATMLAQYSKFNKMVRES
jgi:xylulose-5-phosphate/fructose-6-phosphate phosphoketolase